MQYIRRCYVCGKLFVTNNPNATKCDECKAEVREKQKEKKYAQYRTYNPRRLHVPRAGVAECVAMVDEYNQEHGTKYSYGQYASLVLLGIIKNERW